MGSGIILFVFFILKNWSTLWICKNASRAVIFAWCENSQKFAPNRQIGRQLDSERRSEKYRASMSSARVNARVARMRTAKIARSARLGVSQPRRSRLEAPRAMPSFRRIGSHLNADVLVFVPNAFEVRACRPFDSPSPSLTKHHSLRRTPDRTPSPRSGWGRPSSST